VILGFSYWDSCCKGRHRERILYAKILVYSSTSAGAVFENTKSIWQFCILICSCDTSSGEGTVVAPEGTPYPPLPHAPHCLERAQGSKGTCHHLWDPGLRLVPTVSASAGTCQPGLFKRPGLAALKQRVPARPFSGG